jgi:acetyl esterase/lipase
MTGEQVARLLDPDFESLLDPGARFEFDEDFLTSVRSAEPMPGVESTVVERTDHLVSAELGVRVRVNRLRSGSDPAPCVFSMHGGGYIMGWPTMDDPLFESWCPSLGVVGVSVDYRLAPETPFPGPLDDCYLALKWTMAHADELGVDPDRLGLFGVSAGGGLAASLALLVRDRGEVGVGFQMLESPMLDDRQQTRSSRLEDLPIWSKEANAFGWRSYLGSLYGSAELPVHAVPARAEDLSGLPPAYVSATGVDGFRDEDIDYACRLQHAGVETELHVYPGAPHGYQLFGASYAARKSRRDREEWLQRMLQRL